jgi:uncharacterized RDD family membrane protein YckC
MTQDAAPEQEYAGQRLGLPAEGPRAVASWGRRVAALFVDWLACLLVAQVFVSNTDGFVTMAIFLGEVSIFTTLAGGSFGQLALRLAVVRLDGRRVNLLQAVVRTALICLVIPPVVFDRDNRGLHDLAVGTVTINR